MTEAQFADLIDCKLPYSEPKAVAHLLQQAISISTNATLIVLEEICRPPAGIQISQSALFELAHIWKENCGHPVGGTVFECALALIKREWILLNAPSARWI